MLADLFGGPLLSRPLCQLFPPGFPGRSWYCPYTSGPADGAYHGPDLVRARDLVRASGTAGTTVHLWEVRSAYEPPYSEYLAHVLSGLGYHVVRHVLDAADADTLASRKPQVVSSGWGADFPAPSNFYGGILECVPEPIGFCDEDLDARADRAAALQLTDPGAALREWAALDRASTDLAAAVPGVSTSDWRLTAPRVDNYQSSPLFGPALSQLWVR